MIKYKLDYQNTIKITDEREVLYTISKKHRGRNKEKSYWSIKMPREIALFRSALQNGYEDKANNIAWNLNIVNGENCIDLKPSSEGSPIMQGSYPQRNDSRTYYPPL